MVEPAANADALTQLRDSMPLAALLGVEFTTAGRDEVRATLAWRENLCTVGGVLHGGVVMALADSTGAACALLNLPPDAARTTTIESKTNFFRAVTGGSIEAVSTALHAGRTTIVIETDVRTAEGRRVAKTIQTQAVLRSSP